jgi:molybdopterin-guanine dinucleotide biosynthesis protein B
MVSVIAVVGTSGSGKTTTIEYLIYRLSKDGFKIGSIKHIHHADFSMDTKGTDTWRHTHAGTTLTAAIAPKETVMIKKTDTSKSGLDEVIGLFDKEKLEVIFVEGFHGLIAKRKDIAKIIVAKNQEDLERRLEGTIPPILAITGLVAKKKIDLPKLKIPMIDLINEGDLLVRLVKNHISGKPNRAQ